MMVDYPITSGMQTLYLLSMLCCLGLSRYYFREKNLIQQAGNTVCVLRDCCLLSGFEQRCSEPTAQEFNMIFWMMTKVCLPCKCGLLC